MQLFKKSKKIISFSLLISLLLALTGCSCKHEWSQWAESGEEMMRSCSKCQETECAPLDRDILLKQYFVGSWCAYGDASSGDLSTSPLAEDLPPIQCVFFEDNTFSLKINDLIIAGNWKKAPNLEDYAKFSILTAAYDGSKFLFLSGDAAGHEGDTIVLFLGKSISVLFERSEEPIEIDISSIRDKLVYPEDLIGTWKITYTYNGREVNNTIVFKEDWIYTEETYANGVCEDGIVTGTYGIFGKEVHLYDNENKTSYAIFSFEDGVLISNGHKYEKVN